MERMLDAAAALLREGGLAAVTVASVAERSGTSNGALYHRFGDRGRLVAALQEREQAAMLAATREAFADVAEEPDDERAARALGEAALAIFAEHRAATRAFLVELDAEPEVRARNEAVMAEIGGTVTGWLVTRLGAAPEAAEEAFGLLYALCLTEALTGGRTVGPDAVARAVLAVARG